jgi:tight adherence protein C
MTLGVLGAGLGLLAATGVTLAVVASPPMRRPRLGDRLSPYLPKQVQPSRLLDDSGTATPFPTLERLLGPVLRDLAGRVDRGVGGASSLRRRLDRAASMRTVEQFRVEQVVWGAGGFAIGLLLAGSAAARGTRGSSVGYLFLAVGLAVAGGIGRDRALDRQIRRREERMLEEFPTIAELLALAVGAGEGPAAALERVVRSADCTLSRELGRVVADTRTGIPLVRALEDLAARTPLPTVARFVDGVAIAVERGTPLADLLRAQASDVREAGRRALLEAGGRKEIAMLVPVVFLVLPVTVLFALFPGFYSLRLAVP